MPAIYTYTDLQVRTLPADRPDDDAVVLAVTVTNTGDTDGVETVRVFRERDGRAVQVAETTEQLEVGHGHRVRHTLTAAQVDGADAVAVGPRGSDIRARAAI